MGALPSLLNAGLAATRVFDRRKLEKTPRNALNIRFLLEVQGLRFCDKPACRARPEAGRYVKGANESTLPRLESTE